MNDVRALRCAITTCAAVTLLGMACAPSLAPFADGTLHIATAVDCSEPAEVPGVIELRPAGGASDDACPTLDGGARLFVDDREADIFQRGGSYWVCFAPEGPTLPFDGCNFVKAEVLFSPPDGEHEVRIELGDEAIATTLVIPDGVTSCEGVADCVLEIEAGSDGCG